MLNVVWTMLFLFICAVIDIREQKVFSMLCFANMAAAIIVNVIIQNILWFSILLGMMLGGILWIISICTKEALGKGDAIVVFTLGSMTGVKISLEILTWASVICAFVSIIGLIIKKVKFKSRVPFIPFMFIGGIITLMIEGA